MLNKSRQISKRIFSIAFCASIVVNLMATILLFALVITKVIEEPEPLFPLLWGAMGLIIGLTVFSKLLPTRLRVLIHEIKHALVAIVFGAKLTDVRAGQLDGQVEIEIPEDHLRYYPFICLAPYFFPLSSIPVLVIASLQETESRHLWALGLGLALALDLDLAVKEIHSGQTDFKAIFGGFPLSALFIVSFFFMWMGICLVWVSGVI